MSKERGDQPHSFADRGWPPQTRRKGPPLQTNLGNAAAGRKHEDLPELLGQVPCVSTTYDEWLNVGMGLKAEGYPLDVWDRWSATDPSRYSQREVQRKWDGFNGSGITGATVAKICLDHGAQAERTGSGGITPLFSPGRNSEERASSAEDAPPAPDYSEGRAWHRVYIERCTAAMGEGCDGWAYLTGRGLTADAIKGGRIGWDASKRAVVLPYSSAPGGYYHIERYIDADTHTAHKYDKPPVSAPSRNGVPPVGEEPVYNAGALKRSDVVFVVEGPFDALAVKSCGFEAVAFVSNRSTTTLRRIVEDHYDGCIVLMLDNDEAGRKGEAEARAALSEAGIAVLAPWKDNNARPFAECKDAAEVVEKHGLEALRDVLSRVHAEAGELVRTRRDKAYTEALSALSVKDPADTVASIWLCEDSEEPTPTGIGCIDRMLDGGFYRGVYVLGAVSSLGKTTLMAQLADAVAESGRKVLFVTIEQSAKEIVSKSLSRLMCAEGGRHMAATTRELSSEKRRAEWGPSKTEAFRAACERYTSRIAPNIRVLEALRQPSVADVQAVAGMMAAHDGEPPIVFIDYLQILAPYSDKASDKQATDHNMTDLRIVARELKTTVFVVSSLNRSSYSGAITMEAFKESGAVEYSSDVLLGLQPEGMAEKLATVKESERRAKANSIMKETKASEVRACELVMLKNRNGGMTAPSALVTFRPAMSLFEEKGAAPAVARRI